MDLHETMRVLRSGWWVVLLTTLLGALLGAGTVLATTPVYTADTRLFISTTGTGDDLSAAVEGSVLAQARVSSYAAYLTDLQLAGAVVDDLGLDMTADQLSQEITATVVPDTVILDVTVTDPSPERARDVADSIGTQFDSLIARIETPQGQTTSPIQVTVIAAPELPTQPSSPKPAQSLAIGLVLGLVLGAALVLLRHKMDTRIRTSAQAAALSNGAGLAVIPLDDELTGGATTVREREAPSSESFRQLRTSMDFVDVDSPPRVILVSSSLPGEGKTTVSVNLALALTAAGRRVVLVEADLRRPRVTRYLSLVSGAGLTSVLNGSADLDDVLQPVGDGALQVLAAGPTPPNPGELLASGQMRSVLAELRERADIVLLDGPPLLPVSDAGGLAPATDGVVLCVRYGTTRTHELAAAVRTLDRVGGRTLGSVFTFVPRRVAAEEGLGYTYHYGEDPAPAAGLLARTRARLTRTASRSTPEQVVVPPATVVAAPARPVARTVHAAATGVSGRVTATVPLSTGSGPDLASDGSSATGAPGADEDGPGPVQTSTPDVQPDAPASAPDSTPGAPPRPSPSSARPVPPVAGHRPSGSPLVAPAKSPRRRPTGLGRRG